MCVVIGCLLINSRDTYRSMIVRFTSPATRGFLLPLLFLSRLFAAKENLWDQGILTPRFWSWACHPTYMAASYKTLWKYWNFWIAATLPKLWLENQKLATWLTWPSSMIHFWSQKSGICYLFYIWSCDVSIIVSMYIHTLYRLLHIAWFFLQGSFIFRASKGMKNITHE